MNNKRTTDRPSTPEHETQSESNQPFKVCLNPQSFRSLERGFLLTTVFAIKCRNGVVLCSDAQESAGFGDVGTKEISTKVHKIATGDSGSCLLGCAGVTNYIELFVEYVEEVVANREAQSYYQVLDDGVKQFTKQMVSRTSEAGLPRQFMDKMMPQGIFAGFDRETNSPLVYELTPPHPPRELRPPYRVAIGTGGLYANLLLGIAETVIDRMTWSTHVEPLRWIDFRTRVVSQFCYFVLARVMHYDLASGLNSYIYVLNEQGGKLQDDQDLFPRHGKSDGDAYRVTIFAKTLLEELPKECLPTLFKLYNLESVVGRLLTYAE